MEWLTGDSSWNPSNSIASLSNMAVRQVRFSGGMDTPAHLGLGRATGRNSMEERRSS